FDLFMIQRPQTIFLAIIVVCMGLYLGFPVWQKSISTQSATLNAFSLRYTIGDKVVEETNTIYLAVLAIISGGLALYSIFQFRNRVQQMILNLINTLVMVALLGGSTYLGHIKGNTLFLTEVQGTFKLSFYVIAIALISNVAANRFIRWDEKKVKDAFGRLR
ncbi:MAG: DUF4293 domain-containing protein, partial [Siphonobacter sp.]